jgi:hypothetical protein
VHGASVVAAPTMPIFQPPSAFASDFFC